MPQDSTLLDTYREQLAAGTAGFAEVYYNFLFDNPDVAGVLYSYEKGGGDVGMLVRRELESMLASITGTAGNNRESDLVATGGALFENVFPAGVGDCILQPADQLHEQTDCGNGDSARRQNNSRIRY